MLSCCKIIMFQQIFCIRVSVKARIWNRETEMRGMRGIRVGMRGIGVRMRGIRVGMRGIGVGIWGMWRMESGWE